MNETPGQLAQPITFFVEKAACGFPSPAADYHEQPLDFNELLVPNRASTYCIRAGGDSMSGAGIMHDDILVVNRAVRPMFGDIVVAEYDGGFTVKRLGKPTDATMQAVLHPENPQYPDLPIGNTTELVIFGVVTAVVRKISRNKT